MRIIAILAASILLASQAGASRFAGVVRDSEGQPVVGAMVTLRAGHPDTGVHDVTVFSDDDGAWQTPGLREGAVYKMRVRRIGLRDRWIETPVPLAAGETRSVDVVLEPVADAEELAAQLPANRWYALLLDRVGDESQREELVRQCTYCHQQGNRATRRLRDREEWDKVLSLMARMGGVLSADLRARVPTLFNEAYDLATAVPALTARAGEADFAPPPGPVVRAAVIDEWQLGMRSSMQHDLVVHPDGRVYSVDMMQDKLYRLDPSAPDGAPASWQFPRGDLPLGGVFGGSNAPTAPNANSHVGPHSLQVAPDGSIWSTLALGNQLARFDPETESFTIFPLDEGLYPHTLRFDARGRIWYTLAGSNHVGVLDPASGDHDWIRLPARTWTQALVMRAMPLLLWLNRSFDLVGDGSAATSGGEGFTPPVPYGIDVAPDGSVWFSQLNDHRIGRIDPDTFEVRLVDTPFTAPRRLRFDAQGGLWIPGFSSGVVARFDPSSGTFERYPLPIEPLGSDTPYALNVDHKSGMVWICGTNSDTLIRLDPAAMRRGEDGFTVYPLPTRVTYTREIDFDAQGRVWTSNSNLPAWQIEGGFPRVLRLDPRSAQLGLRTAQR